MFFFALKDVESCVEIDEFVFCLQSFFSLYVENFGYGALINYLVINERCLLLSLGKKAYVQILKVGYKCHNVEL